MIIVFRSNSDHQLLYVETVNKTVLSNIVRELSRLYSNDGSLSLEVSNHQFYWTPAYSEQDVLEEIARLYDTKHEPMSPVSEK